jgi:hypothetical protein
MPNWLNQTGMVLFLSRRRLAVRKAPRATTAWALDSGGFTELSQFGKWTVSPETYVSEVRRWRETIGGLEWAAIQDWMCEPWILEKTGKSIKEHQARTVESWVTLNKLAPDLPWVPVLQGWEHDDYLDHVEQYRAAGLDLAALPLVGLGSVCRRQDTGMAEELIRALWQSGLRLHGFGFKLKGLVSVAGYLASADSLAWSLNTRKNPPLPGCKHKSCGSCLLWAERWYGRVLGLVERVRREPLQRLLF